MDFEFATATRILFGPGCSGRVGPWGAVLGRSALVVHGAPPDAARRAEPLLDDLAIAGVQVTPFGFAGEPTVETARAGLARAREIGCDLVVGFGGGSAIDAGKAIAALLTNEGDPLDYLEVIGAGKRLQRPPAPFVSVPTTAGTGAEVTRNAVLASPEHKLKVSLRSPLMLPRLAVVDPILTYDVPPDVTAATGLDALTQLIEPFVSRRANPLTDGFCRDGIARVARSLRTAYHEPRHEAAREDMALASLLGGMALANAGLGAVHGFAAPLGGRFAAPHGAVCAALLPHVMAANLAALRERGPGEVVARYDEVARILTGSAAARADDGVGWVRELCGDLAIARLAAYGVGEDDFAVLVEQAGGASSMRGNPVRLTEAELAGVLSAAV